MAILKSKKVLNSLMQDILDATTSSKLKYYEGVAFIKLNAPKTATKRLLENIFKKL